MLTLFLSMILASPFDDVVQGEMSAVRASIGTPTITAQADGHWSNAGTWGGSIPNENSIIEIPLPLTVKLDGVAAVKKLMVKGKLIISEGNEGTILRVDTLYSDAHSLVQIGTAQDPCEASVQVIFTGTGFDGDPKRFGRGAVLMGGVEIHGVRKPWASSGGVRKAATEILLTTPLTNWQPGDRIIVAGARNGEQEIRKIVSIAGATVGVDIPFALDHVPATGAAIAVGNLTRNIAFSSEDAGTNDRRGHVMFMHDFNVHVAGAAFVDLGRTNKAQSLTNYKFVPNGTEIAPPDPAGVNFPGRYPVHFHRHGFGQGSATIEDCVVENSPGWGMVNHSSTVAMTGNVVTNTLGAAFVTEAGDEMGSFDRNLAIRIPGAASNLLDPDREKLQDQGFSGAGFWLTGHNVSLSNNVAAGCKSSGYTVWGKPLTQKGLGVTSVAKAYLTNPAWAGNAATLGAASVPLRGFVGNETYGAPQGLDIWFTTNVELSPTSQRSVLDHFTAWNVPNGMTITYTGGVDVRACVLKADPLSSFLGITINEVSRDINIIDPLISGFRGTGIGAPFRGVNSITGGLIDTAGGTAIAVPNVNVIAGLTTHDVTIQDVQFGPGNKWVLTVPPKPAPVSPPKPYDTLGNITFDGHRVRYLEDGSAFPHGSQPPKVKAWVEN